MSLKHLNDDELADFVRDPQKFVNDSSKLHKLLGLSDPDNAKRLEEARAKLGPKSTKTRTSQPI